MQARDAHPRVRARSVEGMRLRRDRVFQIATLMATRQWNKAKQKEVVAEWRLAFTTVSHYAAEASRLLEWTTNDREVLVKFVNLRLVAVAEENGHDRVPALRTILEHLGELMLRQHHTIKRAHDPFDGWTDDEIRIYGETGERPADKQAE